MNRKVFEDLGLDKEVIDKIMSEHGKDVESMKTSLTESNTRLTDAQARVKELEASSKNDNSKAKIEELEKELSETKKELEGKKAEELKRIKENKLQERMKETKVKSPKLVKGLLSDLEFDGKDFPDFDERIKELQEDEETSILFDLEGEGEGDDGDNGKDEKRVFKSSGVDHEKREKLDPWGEKAREALGLE